MLFEEIALARHLVELFCRFLKSFFNAQPRFFRAIGVLTGFVAFCDQLADFTNAVTLVFLRELLTFRCREFEHLKNKTLRMSLKRRCFLNASRKLHKVKGCRMGESAIITNPFHESPIVRKLLFGLNQKPADARRMAVDFARLLGDRIGQRRKRDKLPFLLRLS